MSPEEREEIISLVAERVLLMIPQVIGNMLQEISAQKKTTEKFYRENPLFAQYPEIVQNVLQEVDGQTPGKPWTDKIALAKPIIESKIQKIKSFDVSKPTRPEDFSYGSNSVGDI